MTPKEREYKQARVAMESYSSDIDEGEEKPAFLRFLRHIEHNSQGLWEAISILRGLGDSLYGEHQDEAKTNALARPAKGLVKDFSDLVDHQDELVRDLFREIDRIRRLFP